MKRIVTIMLVAVIASMSAAISAGTRIDRSQLPAAALEFLNKYYPGDNVRKAERDQGHRGLEYEVDLVSGTEIDFTADGSWKEVKAAHGAVVPAAIIPAGIAKHVADNYPGLSIIEISHKRGGYEVELSNGRELHLDENGQAVQHRQGGNRPRR